MRRSFEEILLANKIVSAEQLKQVKNYADSIGIDLHEAVLQRKTAPPDTVMMAYSESVSLPFVNLADITVDENVIEQVNPNIARQYGILPFSTDTGFLQVLSGKPILPDVEEELKAFFSMPLKCVICVPSEINAAITQYFPKNKIGGKTAAAGACPAPNNENANQVTRKPSTLTAEESKNRLLLTIMSFNFSVFIICFALYYLQIPRELHNTSYQFFVLGFCGILAGGIAAYITWRKLS